MVAENVCPLLQNIYKYVEKLCITIEREDGSFSNNLRKFDEMQLITDKETYETR